MVTRSPALRQVRANSGITFRPDANTVLWFPGQDDAFSSTIRDRSGNGNDGTLTGGVTWVQNDKGLRLLDFDGVDGKVDCGSDASIDNIFDGGGTFICWVIVDSDGEGGAGRLFEKGTVFAYTANGVGGKVKLIFSQQWAGDNGAWRTTSTEVTNGTPTLIAITYDSGAAANNPIIYIGGDGTLSTFTVGSGLDELGTPTGAAHSSDAVSPLILGNNGGTTTTFDGRQGLWREVTRILTAAQIEGIYRQEQGLV